MNDSYLRNAGLRPTLLTVYLTRRRKTILAIVCVSATLAALIFYCSHVRCAARIAVLRAQEDKLKGDAKDQLKIGTDKTQVVRFFSEHHMQVDFYLGEASGTLLTTGCAPFGCGADTISIRVSVAVDTEGTVTDRAQVRGMYTNCL